MQFDHGLGNFFGQDRATVKLAAVMAVMVVATIFGFDHGRLLFVCVCVCVCARSIVYPEPKISKKEKSIHKYENLQKMQIFLNTHKTRVFILVSFKLEKNSKYRFFILMKLYWSLNDISLIIILS